MGKEAKTMLCSILDKNKIPYEMNTYTCDEFTTVPYCCQLGQPYERSFQDTGHCRQKQELFRICYPC